jgi:hypothetical protein
MTELVLDGVHYSLDTCIQCYCVLGGADCVISGMDIASIIYLLLSISFLILFSRNLNAATLVLERT